MGGILGRPARRWGVGGVTHTAVYTLGALPPAVTNGTTIEGAHAPPCPCSCDDLLVSLGS